jgi:hypothetical protein
MSVTDFAKIRIKVLNTEVMGTNKEHAETPVGHMSIFFPKTAWSMYQIILNQFRAHFT